MFAFFSPFKYRLCHFNALCFFQWTGYGPAGYALFVAVYAGLEVSICFLSWVFVLCFFHSVLFQAHGFVTLFSRFSCKLMMGLSLIRGNKLENSGVSLFLLKSHIIPWYVHGFQSKSFLFFLSAVMGYSLWTSLWTSIPSISFKLPNSWKSFQWSICFLSKCLRPVYFCIFAKSTVVFFIML